MAKATPQHLDDPTEYKDYKPEEAGSGIRVDGKRLKKDTSISGGMPPIKKLMKQEEPTSKMNAMGDTYAKGGMTASKRADGIAQRGKTRGTMVMCGGGMSK